MDLGKKLREALSKLTGKPYVDEDAVKALIKDLQRVLIANDVNVKLVFEISKRIEERSLKTKKLEALSLKEHVLKVVYEELVALMGTGYEPRLGKHNILLCGLFGSGKTTSVGKIAHFYKSRGLSVLVVGADVDRPAAQEQLEQLAKKVNANFFTIKGEKNAARIVNEALRNAREDIVIVDSAGRSAFDGTLITELKEINNVLKPDETFLVVSADIGQVAGKQAQEFNNAIGISGVIITKMDGSGKGGGALSAVASTNAKTAFIGVGEKVEDLEIYHADKYVGRLLGVPDIAGLMEKVKTIITEEDAKRLEQEEFTVQTFYDQLKQAKKLGPLGNVLGMLGAADVPKEMVHQGEEKMKKFESMINSMTPGERKDASIIRKNATRIARIAKGSGTTENEVREFLSQFEKMEKMIKMYKNNRGFRAQLEKMMKGGKIPGLRM